MRRADAIFVTHARTALPAALATIRELNNDLRTIKALLAYEDAGTRELALIRAIAALTRLGTGEL